jgi:uncharacterized membrane protein YccC
MGSRYVSNELAGTRQAAARQHQTAALRQAEADAAEAAGDEAERTRPAREATDAVALARALDQQAAQMEVSDEPARNSSPTPPWHESRPSAPRPCSPNTTPPTSTPSP